MNIRALLNYTAKAGAVAALLNPLNVYALSEGSIVPDFTVHLASGEGFDYDTVRQTDREEPFYTSQRWLTGDFDGDGRKDLVKVTGENGKAQAELNPATETGFADPLVSNFAGFSSQQFWRVGDFNGDGLDDLVNIYGNAGRARAWVHLSTGTGFEYQSSFTVLAGFSLSQQWQIGDFDGDGRDDLVNIYGNAGRARAWVHRSTGDGFEYQSSFTVLAGFSESQRWRIGDFDGDGRDDLVNVYGNAGRARAWVHRSTGSGFEYQTSFTVLAGFSETQRWEVGDFNGDGKDDLVNVYNNAGQARVWTHYSNANGFDYQSSFQTLGYFFIDQSFQHWLVGDFDSDQKDDLITVEGVVVVN